jgi:hypothetical protein
MARHLAYGNGLQNMGSPVLWYPPGYSILLSPIFFLGTLPLLEISVLHWLLSVGILWGIYRWARLLAPEGAVWIAAISVGTSAVWIHYRRPVSELAFMAAMACLLVSFQALPGARGFRRYLAWLAAAAGLTIAVCLIRSLGIALAAGGSCSLLASAWRNRSSHEGRPGHGPCAARVDSTARDGSRATNLNPTGSGGSCLGSADPSVAETVGWRRALGAALVISAAAVMTVGGVVLHDHWAAQPLRAETYLNSIDAQRKAVIAEGYGPWCALVITEIGRVTVPFMFKSYGAVGAWWNVNMLVYVPLFGLLLYGYYRWVCRGDDPLAWSMPFYLAALTYFRWESGARYWVPMTPALFMCLWFALEPWVRRRDFLRAIWLLHILAALVYWIGVDLPAARKLDEKWPNVRSLAEQITADRDQVVIEESMAGTGMLLTLQLDRRVKEHSGDTPIPTSAKWLIIPVQQGPPPGFAPRFISGGCQLLHRD